LDWDTDFRLLGVDFHGGLIGMENNFDCKLEEIRKLFICWINRTFSVYGKLVIIKHLPYQN
jgi:hypothetical protein